MIHTHTQTHKKTDKATNLISDIVNPNKIIDRFSLVLIYWQFAKLAVICFVHCQLSIVCFAEMFVCILQLYLQVCGLACVGL